jgi:hypothetical protein
VSGPDASDPLRHADGDEHDARWNEDEGRRPDSQTDTDREHTIRTFAGYDSSIVGHFRYAPAFDLV